MAGRRERSRPYARAQGRTSSAGRSREGRKEAILIEKILITGGSGLLGGNLARMSTGRCEVYATYNTNPVRMDGVHFFRTDLTKNDSLSLPDAFRPDIIVHCAALTNVDYCEAAPDTAYVQNVLASANVAKAAKKAGAYLIHISTDSVFSGDRGGYRERDEACPVNVYGRTKLEAESVVSTLCPGACIARTNIYGWNLRNKQSLAEWMLDMLTTGRELPAFRDVVFTPILVNDLADALFTLYEKSFGGLLHVCGSEACSKLDFARVLADVFGLDAGLIAPSSVDDALLKAPRGKNISLDTARAEGILGRRLPGVRDGLERMRALRETGYVEELRHG